MEERPKLSSASRRLAQQYRREYEARKREQALAAREGLNFTIDRCRRIQRERLKDMKRGRR